MSRQPVQTALILALLALLSTRAWVNGGEEKSDPARDALVKFDKHWKPSTNAPNYGDPRWKLKMETLVKLAKAGHAALPLLEIGRASCRERV